MAHHPDELAFLAAIDAKPDVDLPRLVFADWLDEQGFSYRAEFIRLQCEIAIKETLPRPAMNAFVHLWQRQQELTDHHLPELLGPENVALARATPRFRRGFVDELSLHVRDFLEVGAIVAELRPRPSSITVTNLLARPTEFIRSPFLGCVTRLECYDDSFANRVPNELEPPLERDEVLASLARLNRLEALSMEGLPLGEAGMQSQVEEADFPIPPRLVEIDFSYCELTDNNVIDLLNVGFLRRMKRIILGGNPITDQAALELADRLGPVRTVEHLNLRFTGIGNAGRAALLAAFGSRVDLF